VHHDTTLCETRRTEELNPEFHLVRLDTELTSQAVRFINTQIEQLTDKETPVQEEQWTLEDQINDLQKQTYNATAIAYQLKEFVQNFPQLQAGERKLLVDALIERLYIRKNKRVILFVRSPFAFGFFSR
jgi:hypothetical protein